MDRSFGDSILPEPHGLPTDAKESTEPKASRKSTASTLPKTGSLRPLPDPAPQTASMLAGC